MPHSRKAQYAVEPPRPACLRADWEKTNIAERTGQRPNLSAVSTTKDGAEVQIDDFDPDRVEATVDPALAAAPASGGGKSGDCSGATRAVGIAGGSGDDRIANRGTVAAKTKASSAAGMPECDRSKHGHGSHKSEKVDATSAGILGDEGRDEIENAGSITVESSDALNGGSLVAKGIVGDNGDDTVTNTETGAITVTATVAKADIPVVPLGGSGSGAAPADESGATATSKSTAVNVEVNAVDGALADAKLDLDATAVGIDASRGKDRVENSGTVKAGAHSQVTQVKIASILSVLANSL
ncbi:MAG TPA: hypothetical protein VF193_01125 [Steroidobacter sp.]|jgi:hypothetical protein